MYELKKIYQTPVARVATNNPSQRSALGGVVCPDQQSKWQAIAEEVKTTIADRSREEIEFHENVDEDVDGNEKS